ncbi:hypothetical protein [Endozoicomonas numazuensis]|uniref:Uncharacterized protein n=1 Tax=Endozoicomonas numazuensis TaxID=1137799 RepID=A0A081N978_9GAMM|nr:hypothetical protein [Endozoicomonas numazuensis]KEQ15001.1 hypothetical protein GZ78_24245 [Endozoicomonas numazuensis]
MRHLLCTILSALLLLISIQSKASSSQVDDYYTILCAEATPPGTMSDFIVARLPKTAKPNPNTAARAVEQTLNDKKAIKVACTAEAPAIRSQLALSAEKALNKADLKLVQELSKAAENVNIETSTQQTLEGHTFHLARIPAADSEKIFKSIKPGKRSSGEMPGLGLAMLIASVPVTVLTGHPEYIHTAVSASLTSAGLHDWSIYYLLFMGTGVALQGNGVWTITSIFLTQAAALTAYAGALLKEHPGEDFNGGWDMSDHDPDTLKNIYNTLKASSKQGSLVTTTAAVLIPYFQRSVNALGGLAKLGSTELMAIMFIQNMAHIGFENITGHPLEEYIPGCEYNDAYAWFSPWNTPYYAKKLVTGNFLLIAWSLKKSGWAAGKATWIGGHLAKAGTYIWKKKKSK